MTAPPVTCTYKSRGGPGTQYTGSLARTYQTTAPNGVVGPITTMPLPGGSITIPNPSDYWAGGVAVVTMGNPVALDPLQPPVDIGNVVSIGLLYYPPPAGPPQGCTNPLALNYSPAAVVDNGSCIYPVRAVRGCTSPTARNYNPLAVVDDNSCVYWGAADPVPVCTWASGDPVPVCTWVDLTKKPCP